MIRLLCVVGTLILLNLSPAEADPAAGRTPLVAENTPRASSGTSAEPSPRAPSATTTVQLPPEIMVDRHLIRAERLLAADDPEAALDAMNEILALQQEHDLVLQDDFHFQYARMAFAAGRTQTAIASLNEYLIAAGRAGEFYRRALQLLDSAEVRLREEERAARWPPGGVFRDCEMCPEMVVLPGGDLALGRYEVTVAEYRAFASAIGRGAGAGCDTFDDDGDSWRNPGFPQTDRHPVTCVSWDDAQAYASWLRRTTGAPYRLQSEEDWDRVLAGSQPGCHRDRTGRPGTCPVGSYGANPAGLSDMAGNLGVQRQLLLPLDDSHFCRLRSSWIENQPGPEHAAARGVLPAPKVGVAVDLP